MMQEGGSNDGNDNCTESGAEAKDAENIGDYIGW